MPQNGQATVGGLNIKPAIIALAQKNLKPESVKDQIVAFFRAFDEFKEEQVVRMQTQLDQ